MEIRIVDNKEFKVRGYKLRGPIAKIPDKWEKLNLEMANGSVFAEESFGVIMGMEGHEIRYIAGLRSHLAESFTDSEEVIIPEGRFAVAAVSGGVSAIATTFNAVMKTPNIRLRESFSFERYILLEGKDIDQIEVWLPIE